MKVIKCSRGHFYDSEKFKECPHCGNASTFPKNPLNEEKTSYIPKNIGTRIELAAQKGEKEERTVGFFRTRKGGNPVVGWLVCINGSEWGRDFRIFAGKNKIGRGLTMDLVLADDLKVSGENHCFIIFEPKKTQYLLQKGLGDLVLVNDVPLEDVVVLTGDEKIQIGSGTFVFIPFCKEGRQW